MAEIEKEVTFTEFFEPRLKSGEYWLHAALEAGPKAAPTTFTADRRFAVAGLRFKLGGDDVASLFPPPLANGEFRGVLPQAVLARPTLPWSRTCVAGAAAANVPWLAVLTLQEDEIVLPTGATTPIVARTAADLVPAGTSISVMGAAPLEPPVVGTMPSNTVSTPGLATLDFGESPNDPVNTIDLDVDLFSKIAPTAADLALLANARTVDTFDSVDSKDEVTTRAIVLGNRAARVGAKATALLVSLENLGAFLPDDAGTPSAAFGAATTVRLIVLVSWQFFVNDGDETLNKLLSSLDADGLATVRVPGAVIDAAKVRQATDDAPTGIDASDADALVANALAAGFVPLDHHLREGGDTVSWLRGPLISYRGLTSYPLPPVIGPDALLRYDPEMGMFDVSYAAAWQLGQLMALQSRSFSVALLQWKQQTARGPKSPSNARRCEPASTRDPNPEAHRSRAFSAGWKRTRPESSRHPWWPSSSATSACWSASRSAIWCRTSGCCRRNRCASSPSIPTGSTPWWMVPSASAGPRRRS